MTVFGFLHTADGHVRTFTGLLLDLAPDDDAVHVVDATLLTDARRRGEADDDLRARIGTHLGTLTDRGAVRVVCTCSTIGGPAEEVGRTLGVDVLRVDRPMAEAAVRHGGRITVVAALESTVEPTRRLLREAADAAGAHLDVVDALCPEAWPFFEAGDLDRYYATLAAHLQAIDAAGDTDVIVLAQASMAPVDALVHVATPVLSSPRTAVTALVTRP